MFGVKDWSTQRDRAGSLHIVPNEDDEKHPLSWTCPCMPAFVAVMDPFGVDVSWVFEHEAWDGREE